MIIFRQQSGVALLSVMLMLVLLSTLLIYSADIEDMNIRRLSNIREAEQGFQVTMGGEQWGIKILEKDLELDNLKGSEAFDHQSEEWGQLGGAVEVEGTETTMLVSVEDAQGRINLNNLIQPVLTEEQENRIRARIAELSAGGANSGSDDPDVERAELESSLSEIYWYKIFQNLLVNLDLDPELADVIADWIDSDSNTRGTTGAEDLHYQGLDVPYRAANRQIYSTAELSLMKDFDADIIAKLAPFVTALPVASTDNLTKLNINTAPPAVLAALVSSNPDLVESLTPLIEQRSVQPYSALTGFLDNLRSTVNNELPNTLEKLLDTRSDYYFTYSCAETGKVKLSQRSVMFKNRQNENVKVLSRERYFGCADLGVVGAASDNDEDDVEASESTQSSSNERS